MKIESLIVSNDKVSLEVAIIVVLVISFGFRAAEGEGVLL